jgi:hypothetical protein
MAQKATVIELANNTLTVVELWNQSSGIEVVRHLQRPLPEPGIDPAWLRSVLAEAGFSQKRIICSIPATMLQLKTVTVPVLTGEQLQAAIQMELDSANHHNNIFKVIYSQPQEEMLLVKVIEVNNKDFTGYLKLFRDAGLTVLWSGTRAAGILNFLNFNRDFLKDQLIPAAYLDLNETKTEFGVFYKEELLYRRDFTPAARELSEGSPAAVTDFLEEVRLSMASYHAGIAGPIPGAIWLFGRVEYPEIRLSQLLGNGYQVVIPKTSSFTGVRISGSQLSEAAPLLGLALGELVEAKATDLRFYSQEQQVNQNKQSRWLRAALAVMLGVVFAGGIFLGLRAGYEKNRKIQEWLAGKAPHLTRLRKLESETNRQLGKIHHLDEWLAQKNRELEFLRVFQDNLPAGTVISDITIEEGNVKDISGVTPLVSLMLDRFKQLPGLGQLKLKGAISLSDQGEMFHLEGPIILKEHE